MEVEERKQSCPFILLFSEAGRDQGDKGSSKEEP
jgi:hypothetical protein